MAGGAQVATETPEGSTASLWPGEELPCEKLRGETLRRETLRGETAARLAAHRARRGAVAGDVVPAPCAVRKPNSVASAVAEAVAARYAHSPSYRSYLAAEAEQATQRAAAAAQVAARTAEAVARAEDELKEELGLWPASDPVPQGLTVRLYEDLGNREKQASQRAGQGATRERSGVEELALDEEIAFRQSPVFAEPSAPPVAIPGNLLEFPRQLVAARKARPVLALGPLRESSGPAEGQLRIFEVEPQEINVQPAIAAVEPEWRSIWLDTPAASHAPEPAAERVVLVDAAPLSRRAMAAVVDGLLILTGSLGFAALATFLGGAVDLDLRLELAGGAALMLMTGLYYALFFTLSQETPGMRYARIGLCTFSDENPTRRAIRRRMLATLVAVCPLGLGIGWALLDEDRLGWHDRISRMYQRAY